jgi:hypothetical protein
MTVEKPEEKPSRTRLVQLFVVDATLTIAGLSAIVVGLCLLFTPDVPNGVGSLGAGLVLLFAATVTRFEVFKGLGMEVKLRKLDRTIAKAEVTLEQLRSLAEQVGANLVTLNSRIGTHSGKLSFMEAYHRANEVRRSLVSLGSDTNVLRRVLSPWAQSAALDLYEVKRLRIHAELDKLNPAPGTQLTEQQGMQMMERGERIRAFLYRSIENREAWPITEIAVRLAKLSSDAPDLTDEQRATLAADFAIATVQLAKLEETMDFEDPAYWAALKQ